MSGRKENYGLLNQFQNKRLSPKLTRTFVCEAPIKAEEHKVLKHDSKVDCHIIYGFYDWDFRGERGAVSLPAKKDILKAVKICPSLSVKYKDLILTGNEALLDEDSND